MADGGPVAHRTGDAFALDDEADDMWIARTGGGGLGAGVCGSDDVANRAALVADTQRAPATGQNRSDLASKALTPSSIRASPGRFGVRVVGDWPVGVLVIGAAATP